MPASRSSLIGPKGRFSFLHPMVRGGRGGVSVDINENLGLKMHSKSFQAILNNVVFSPKSDSRIANFCSSVCPSVTKTPQPLRIAPIGHRAYQPLSLSTIEPIDH